MKTLAKMGIELWQLREPSGEDPKVAELIRNIEIALKIDKDQIDAVMARAEFSLSEVLRDSELKPKLFRLCL